ncbi:MAG: ABC transporter substrate-binding protein [Pseudomonadota bacterium]
MYRKHIFLTFSLVAVLMLGGCDYLENFGSGEDDEGADTEFSFEDEGFGDGTEAGGPLVFLAPRSIASMPWFLAAQEGVFDQYNGEFGAGIEFREASRRDSLEQFADGEADAVIMTNIDAVATVVGQAIEADVIMVCGYSQGNSAILISPDSTSNLIGKTVAVEEFSADHYLLDRFLLKNLIDFDQVNIRNSEALAAAEALSNPQVDAVITSNPELTALVNSQSARVLFDSREIPKEIAYFLVVRRSRASDRPATQVLYATWNNVMERLLGNQRAATLDSLAGLNNMERAEFERQFNSIVFTDTESKVLSTLRDRKLQKTMRHVRFFIENHQLATGGEIVANWYSLPGRTPATLHFNAAPMEYFIAP